MFFIGFELSYRFITTLACTYVLGAMIIFSFYQIHLYIYNGDENILNEDKNTIVKLIIGYNRIWIFVFSTIFTIFHKLKIQIILKYFSCIMLCYCIFIFTLIAFTGMLYYLVIFFVLPIIKNFDKINLLTNESCLYYAIFLSFILSKLLSFKCLEKFLSNIGVKDRTEYEIIMKQNNLTIFYINIVITLILKPLNFENGLKTIVDAFFYSTTCMGLIFSAKEKANACEKSPYGELENKLDDNTDDDNWNEENS